MTNPRRALYRPPRPNIEDGIQAAKIPDQTGVDSERISHSSVLHPCIKPLGADPNVARGILATLAGLSSNRVQLSATRSSKNRMPRQGVDAPPGIDRILHRSRLGCYLDVSTI